MRHWSQVPRVWKLNKRIEVVQSQRLQMYDKTKGEVTAKIIIFYRNSGYGVLKGESDNSSFMRKRASIRIVQAKIVIYNHVKSCECNKNKRHVDASGAANFSESVNIHWLVQLQPIACHG